MTAGLLNTISKTAYDIETGKILYTMSGKEGFIVFQEIEGVAYADGIGDAITQEVVNGIIVNKPPSVIEQQEIAAAWVQLRAERSRRLFASDWTQVADAPVDHQAWAEYRQALRDLPDNTEDPRHVVWPVAP
jgi:hypothetical protein